LFPTVRVVANNEAMLAGLRMPPVSKVFCVDNGFDQIAYINANIIDQLLKRDVVPPGDKPQPLFAQHK